MSPIDRDRAREKRRYENRQKVLQQRAVDRKRNQQVGGVVLAVLLVVGGLIWLSTALGGDAVKPAAGPTSPATPGASGTGTAPATTPATTSGPASGPATGTATGTATKAQVAGCTAVPKVPGTRTAALPAKSTAAGRTWVATVTTTCGVITMELDGTKAPQTVASFMGLARTGYWNDSPCHRLTVEGLFVLQCGDPTGTGGGNPGYGFGIENAPADGKYPAGTLAMARTTDPNSNGGQFFVVYKDTVLPTDGGGYSIFGKVTGGLDIVDKIAAAGTTPDTAGGTPPNQPISILKVVATQKKA